MIEQQIFIKSGVGLENFGSSSGVNGVFLDAFIRPYYSSLDLFYLEGKDSFGFKSMIPLSNGALMIGSGARQDKPPFSFIHNYIVPQSEVEKILEDPSNLLSSPGEGVTDSNLIALSKIPSLKKDRLEQKLNELSVQNSEFTVILAAIFAAVEQNRNVFIALPRKAGLIEAEALMYGLYEKMPYYLRGKTGFTTLYGETELKNGINVYFIPDEKIIATKNGTYIETYNASRDYIFNFQKRTHLHIGELKEDVESDYISLAAESMSTGKSLSDFFEFAKEAGKNLSHEKKISLRFYNDLAYIYNLEKNEESLPYKAGRVTIIFTELLRYGAGERIFAAYSEFIKLYRRFIKGKNIPMPPEIIKRLAANYDFCPQDKKDELYDLLTLDIDICLKEAESEILFLHIDSLKGSPELYNKVIRQKMTPSNRLIKKYFTYLLARRKTIHSLMEFLENLCLEMPEISQNELIGEMILESGHELYDTSGDRLEAVWYLDSKCSYLKEKYPYNKELFSSIYRYALENYMNYLTVLDLDCQRIDKFPLTDAESINDQCTLKHKIILAAKEILALTNDVALSFVHYDAFGFENIPGNLSDDEEEAKIAEEELKKLVLSCLKEKKDAPRFIQYIILFYVFETKNSRVQHDFDGIFEYIEKELKIPALDFMKWYLSSKLFVLPVVKNGKKVRESIGVRADLTLLTAFYESVRKYFLRNRDLLKGDRNMKILKKEMEKSSLMHQDYRDLTLEFRKVLSNMKRENYSAVRRLTDKVISAKNFKFSLMVSCLLIVIVGGFVLGKVAYDKFYGNSEEKIKREGQIVGTNRVGWSSYILKKDGTYLPLTLLLDGEDTGYEMSFESDQAITLKVSNDGGMVVDGISISSAHTEESVGFLVYVTDAGGEKHLIGITDYDIESGASLYTLPESMCIREIIIEPKDRNDKGKIVLKEVNAYIIK